MALPISPAGHRWSTFNSPSRPSLYSALALHIYRDPKKWSAVRDEIRCKFTHHWVYPQSPEYERCRKIGEKYQLEGGDASSIPQGHPAYTGAVLRGAPTFELLGLAADILDIRIELEGEDDRRTFGPEGTSRCRIWIEKHTLPSGQIDYHVSLLKEDGTGAGITTFLEDVRSTESSPLFDLPIKKLMFCWKTWLRRELQWHKHTGRLAGPILCANEYQEDSQSISAILEEASGYKLPADNEYDISTDPKVETHETYTVCISDAKQIDAAVDLLFEAVDRVGGQNASIGYNDGNRSSALVKPYVGVDAEFVKKTNPDCEAWRLGGRMPGYTEFVSVLTFAIDEHLVIMFYLLDMLYKPNKDTVPAIHDLLVRTIFNDELLKVWHNPQSDMRVLETTVQLMYRGPYLHTLPGYRPENFPKHEMTLDDWPDESNEFFQEERPSDIMFPLEGGACYMHFSYSSEARCPCRLLNVELGAVFDFACNSLGIKDGTCNFRTWTKARHRYNWADLIHWFLAGDRLEALIIDCKSAPDRSDSKHEFYQSLGPGMETDTAKMAYNIGDVIGIVRMFKLLICADDPDVLAMRLYNQNLLGRDDLEYEMTYMLEIEGRLAGSTESHMIPPDAYKNIAQERERKMLLRTGPVPVGRDKPYSRGPGRNRGGGSYVPLSRRSLASPMAEPSRPIRQDEPDFSIPHVSTKFREDTTGSVLPFLRHDERAVATRKTVRQLLDSMPSLRDELKQPREDGAPSWHDDEMTWQQHVLTEAHTRSFDARSFRLPNYLCRERELRSTLSDTLLVPATTIHLENLDVCVKNNLSVNPVQHKPSLLSLLSRFRDERPSISTRLTMLAEAGSESETFRAQAADKIAKCPRLDPRLDKNVYATSSKTLKLRQAWLAKVCLEELPQAEELLDEDSKLIEVYGGPGLVDSKNVFDWHGRKYRERVESSNMWSHANHTFPDRDLTKNAESVICIYIALQRFAEDERRMRPCFNIEADLQEAGW